MSVPPISPTAFAIWFKSLPECGATCLIEAIQTQSNCSITDPACSCTNQAVQAAAETCVISSCAIPDALTTQNLTNSICGIKSVNDRTTLYVLYPFLIFSSIIVVLRCVVRWTQRIPFWWDDYAALLSALISVGYAVLCGIAVELGVGLEIWAVNQEHISTILILVWVGLLSYSVARFLIRVSIMMFMMRIFRVQSTRRGIICILVLNAAITVTYLFCLIFQCTPVSYFWNIWDGLHDGHCINQWAIFLSAGIITPTLDIALILLPVRWISQVQLSRSKKIVTIGMFSLGALVVVTSIMRIISLKKYVNLPDITRNLPDAAIWSGLELYVANICACLPSLRLLLRLRISNIRDWATGASKNSGSASHGVSGSSFTSSNKRRLVSDDGLSLVQFEARTATSNDLARI